MSRGDIIKFTLVFISPNGTTRKTTLILKDNIEKHNHVVNLIDIGNETFREDRDRIFENIGEADIVGFGSPAYHMDMLIPMKLLFDDLLKKHKDSSFKFKAFFYLNYAGITTGKAFENARKVFMEMKIQIIGAIRLTAPHFHHKEDFPNANTVEYVERFFESLMAKDFSPINEEKLNYIFLPDKKLVHLVYPFVHFIGKKRELSIHMDETKCKKCRKCLKECPAGAIKFHDRPVIDFSQCIHCYHCVSGCPFHAVDCRIEKLDKMIELNKKIIGMENPLNKIFV